MPVSEKSISALFFDKVVYILDHLIDRLRRLRLKNELSSVLQLYPDVLVLDLHLAVIGLRVLERRAVYVPVRHFFAFVDRLILDEGYFARGEYDRAFGEADAVLT